MKRIVIHENVSHIFPQEDQRVDIRYRSSDGMFVFASERECLSYEKEQAVDKAFYRQYATLCGIQNLIARYENLNENKSAWKSSSNICDWISYCRGMVALKCVLQECGTVV